MPAENPQESLEEQSFVLDRQPKADEDANVKAEEELNDAAVKIQSTFRGFIARKQLEEQGKVNILFL